MTYSYEIVSTTSYPTGAKENFYSFKVPVSIGDQLRLRNGQLTRVENIEHREGHSIIYCYMEPDPTNW